ncbi:serpin peptidase inhibitor, clade A (alpha-1 antiproteinase, antitrypsin), member 10a [Gadus chalcogrammus]|uniref:serpin peptidase inhibitor, clade A (alpha-1 antiproteinase, antitrypsin), member 10a n=1 Tax=Gadus chalcogrammus TaxID=1042646 RepID=UPI0024C496AA|nr:serpin peptidase inhibitor, clade A (alpha-1 antiproteinase, antitrypsin), member 10a [Gadus chalcogrammus]
MSGGLWILGAVAALLSVHLASSQELTIGNAVFASRLYRAVSSRTDDNVLLSPYTLSAAVAMLASGCEGATRQQLLSASSLGSLEPTNIPGLFQALQNSITVEGGFPLQQGLAVFPSTAYTLAPSYQELVETQFRGKAQGLSYASRMEAMHSINSWALSQTADQVKDVVGSLDAETKLLLVSVAYYQTQFSFLFNASITQDERFYVNRYQIVQVPMMFHSGKHHLAYDPSLKLGLLKLPMAGGVAMLVMLPDENISVTSVEEEFTAERFQGWLLKLKRTRLEVQLPRFLMESSSNLQDVLKQMKVTDVFQDGADLSGMTTDEGIQLTQVYHKAAITVDESGPVTGRSPMEIFNSPPPRLTINRPFLFTIYHEKTGSILHMGRVVDPSQT